MQMSHTTEMSEVPQLDLDDVRIPAYVPPPPPPVFVPPPTPPLFFLDLQGQRHGFCSWCWKYTVQGSQTGPEPRCPTCSSQVAVEWVPPHDK